MIGAEEGLFSLLITPSQDPVMEQVCLQAIILLKAAILLFLLLMKQVSPRPCQWLRVVENVLVWLSSKHITP